MVRGVLLGYVKVFGLRFLGCHWWDVKPQGEISFIFQGFRFHLHLMDLKLTLFFFVYFPIE